ncbi:MAG: MmgE/PrpD family protein [Gammaproteobacteria bacterium]|nr:MmgE/PrpD family protein [Gammaproteobacteria bacterium]MDH3447941.1 MmgE/PrpD family protein [Gammaproteobacteria bacterium]
MTQSAETALQRIANYISRTPIKPGAQSLGFVRAALTDIYGCMLAGAGQPVARNTRQALINCGQINEHAHARIYGTTCHATPGAAAMANAVAGHALEFDDWEVPGNTHISVLLFPAILAASCDRALSGQDAIAAYLAGYETIARIGEAINLEHYEQGWHATATIGTIGVAASVSRLMGLDGEQTANALAIATSRALGYNAQFGSEAKPLQVGFAVEGGLVAAHLAATGLTGQPHMLEHATGMVALMGHRFSDRIETAMARIGQAPAIDHYHIVFKPWPSCGYTHRIMTGMLELRSRGIDPAAIDQLELHLPDLHAGILPFRHPKNRSEALFSLPYCAATILLRGDMTVADLDNQGWRDEDIRQLIDKTSVTGFAPNRPELNYDPEQPDRVVATMGDAIHAVNIPYPLGSPQKPMSENRHFRKFQMNTGLDETRAQALWERLGTWPSAANIHDLLVMSPGSD